MEAIRKTLREWRAYKNLDKQDIAAAIGVHPSTYAKWEAKPSDMKIREAVRVAQALECEVSAIIFFESNPKFSLGEQRAVNQ
ncbi:helix-turn-helix transcriptional regulator [Cohnella panacarvi]|uniref:helix-turn-helix transcriptional regulator n=1 Tax=Cohnella panacarvi TaxID=400776 RepID=UPI00047DA815|nr:helix-turn-helix transcriptional regulator [Cohnella panacarvi]